MSTTSTINTAHSTISEPQRLPHIALAIGDPAGIGPEIIISLLADPSIRDLARVTLIGNRFWCK